MAAPSKGNQDVSDTSVQILAANELRNGAILFNNGSVDVYLGFGEDAVDQEGIKVPAGGSATLNFAGVPQGYDDIFQNAINGIAASGTNQITYQEI